MDYGELKDRIDALEGQRRKEFARVLSLAALGGRVRPEFALHLAGSKTPEEFFDAVYDDDGLRFTQAWAAWAQVSGKNWVDRFDARGALASAPLYRGGLPVVFSDGAVSVPTGLRGRNARILLFDDGDFNEAAASYLTTVEGSFSCAGEDFAGTYDVFSGCGAVLLERWILDERGERAKAAELARKFQLTG